MTGQRGRLGGHTLHQVTVTALDDDPVIDDAETLSVEPSGQKTLGHRHPDGIGHTLAERAGRHLDTRQQSPFGMTSAARSHLTERADVLESHVITGQVQSAVKDHRGMPTREHESVSVRPGRARRVVTQVAGVEPVDDRGDIQRRTRWPELARLTAPPARNRSALTAGS
jgi:hypothetical protein